MRPLRFSHPGRPAGMPPKNAIHSIYSMSVRNPWVWGILLLGVTGFMVTADVNAEYILRFSLKYPGIDKLAHFIMHAVLVSIVYVFGRSAFPRKSAYSVLLGAMLLSALLGVIDEIQQGLVVGRDFDVFDIVSNLCGALSTGILITLRTVRRRYLLVALLAPLGAMYLVVAYSYSSSQNYQLGLMYIKQKDYVEARKVFRVAIEQGEALPALYNELAWVELEYLHTDPALSLVYTQRAITEQPENPDFLDTHGWALHMNGRNHEALEYLLAAYQIDNRIYCINYHLGAVYYALGMYAEARSYLQAQISHKGGAHFHQRARKLLRMMEIRTGKL